MVFLPNSIVKQNQIMGRVVCHDLIERKVHVLVRVNENTWYLRKWDDLKCELSQSFLWHMETPFAARYNNSHKTPNLDAMEIDEDVHILYLNR